MPDCDVSPAAHSSWCIGYAEACGAAHLLSGRPVGAKLCFAVGDGHLHQLQLRALFDRLLAPHAPAREQAA